MKKILIGLAAIVVLLIAAVFIVPSVINWKSYEPEIAKAVRDATGRELHIDGDISVSVLPLSVSIGAFRLSNVEGMPSPDMISVAGVDVKLALFPLIGSSVVVESLVVREPAIFLEVDESGRPNWLFEPAAPAPAAPAPAAPAPAEAGLPISGLELADVRIEDGLFSFIDATTGQNGISQARNFSEATECTGIILAKLDGSAKGGVVVPIRQQMGIPVKYVGVGEQIDDLEAFDPDRFVDVLVAD